LEFISNNTETEKNVFNFFDKDDGRFYLTVDDDAGNIFETLSKNTKKTDNNPFDL
jgi:hypothetical protein